MKIEYFQFHDKAIEWRLKKVEFSELTLLVGISGVGKTQILNSLLKIKHIVEGKPLNGIKWEIGFRTQEGTRYKWHGEFETKAHIINSEALFIRDEELEPHECILSG